MLVTRRRFLKRAALWIAAPAIVRAANIMAISPLSPPDGLVEPSAWEVFRSFSNTIGNLPPIEWFASSVFIPSPPPLNASAGDVFDHFAKATALPTLGSTDGQARLSDDKKGPIRASVGKGIMTGKSVRAAH
jgi:hypothetical protein